MGSQRKKGQGAASAPESAAADALKRVDSARNKTRRSLSEFEGWMKNAGISWDTTLIQLRLTSHEAVGDPDTAAAGGLPPADASWAVYAVTDVPEGRVLATVPRATVLSAANCGLADVLAAERLGGGLALVAGVMYEAARGHKSKWYGYLSSLPPREYLPPFWDEQQLSELRATDIEEKAHADSEAMAGDFESEVAPLLGRYPTRLGPLAARWTLEAFTRAASWVASRAFYVDEHHGMALVPLADVFNHKAARVDLGGGSSWADGFMVAEHEDAKQQQQQHRRRRHLEGGGDGAGGHGRGGESKKRRRRGEGNGGGSGSGSGSASRDDESEQESNGDEEEEDGEQGEEEQGGSSSDGSGSGEGEEGGDDTSSSGSGDEDGGGQRRRRRQRVPRTDLDRDPGDDGDSPWPAPPPPPSPPPQSKEVADKAANTAEGENDKNASGGGCGRGRRGPRGRWALLAQAAVAGGRPNLHLDIGICAVERGGCEVLDIVAAQPLASGAEVYNTYGEHGNAELVVKYGFALPHNPFDEVSLDKARLVAAAEAQLKGGTKAVRKRVKFLEQHSELLSENEEPFLLLPPYHVSTALYVTLRVLAADDRQMAAWTGLEDVIAPLRAAWEAERQEQQQPEQQQLGEQKSEAQEQKPADDLAPSCEAHQQSTGKRKQLCGLEADTEAAASNGGRKGRGDADPEEGPEGRAAKRSKKATPNGGVPSAAGRRGSAEGGEAAPRGPNRGGGKKRAPPEEGEGEEDGSSGEGDDDSDGDGDEDDLPEDVEIPPPAPPPPGAQPGGPATATGAAKKEKQKGRKGASAAVPSPSVPGGLWTLASRSLLRRAVVERLAAYPTSLEDDERTLEELKSRGAVQQQEGQEARGGDASAAQGRGKQQKGKQQKTQEQTQRECTLSEAQAAASCALVLRVGEKRLLAAVRDRLGG